MVNHNFYPPTNPRHKHCERCGKSRDNVIHSGVQLKFDVKSAVEQARRELESRYNWEFVRS